MKIIYRRIIVVLYLNKKSRSEKVNAGNATHTSMTANTGFFPTVESGALLTALQTATGNLSSANAATASGSHESYAAADVAELQFDMAMRNTAYYVQSKADALPAQAEEIILAASMRMKKASTKMQPPVPISVLEALVTGNGNSIRLIIVSENPRGTRYEILMTSTPDVESSWVSIADITAKKFLVEDLTHGVRYYFKARAINSMGRSIYTEVVSQIAA